MTTVITMPNLIIINIQDRRPAPNTQSGVRLLFSEPIL